MHQFKVGDVIKSKIDFGLYYQAPIFLIVGTSFDAYRVLPLWSFRNEAAYKTGIPTLHTKEFIEEQFTCLNLT
jgi:hypothetical protein